MAIVVKKIGLGTGADLEIGGAGTPGLVTPASPDMAGIGGQVLRVGVGQPFTTVAAAIGASHDGDVIQINAGTYTNDFATIKHRITIEGVGGRVNMVATIAPPNSKGIFVVDNDVTIKNLSFSGAAIPNALGGNGAGIRYEGGKMVLLNDAFIGNQNGVMGNPVIAGLTNTVTIDHCVFSGNGSGTGYTHNLYIGAVANLIATNSIFQNAVIGHEFKSRALVNDIENNVFSDGPTGSASYSIDLPNGGQALIKNNVIERGPMAQQANMIHFGGEGTPYAGSSLTVTGNSFVNDRTGATVGVLNQTTVSAIITANSFAGIAAAQIARGPATETHNTDGAGAPLMGTAPVVPLPASTLVITDTLAHSVTLDGKTQAVHGGAGHLTVTAAVSHVIAIAGLGGMDFSELPNSGGNQIATIAGSVNRISITGQDLIDSEGTDRIIGGANNITGQIGGNATVDDGSDCNMWTVSGVAAITGHGGNTVVNVGTNGNATIGGSFGHFEMQNNGGSGQFDIFQGGAEEAMSILGGGVNVQVSSGQTTVTTAAGLHGSVLRFGANAVLASGPGSDVMHAGSGNATVTTAAGASTVNSWGQDVIYGGNGNQTITLHGNAVLNGSSGHSRITLMGTDTLNGVGYDQVTVTAGANATIRAGSLTSVQETGAVVIYTIGTGTNAASATISGGSASLTGGTGTPLSIVTDKGASTLVTLGNGAAAVTAQGSDTIRAGTGSDTVTITAANTQVWGGSGALTVRNDDLTAGDTQTVHGGLGSLIASGGRSLMHFIAGSGNTSLAMGTGGGEVTFGIGNTTVQVAGSGKGVLFDFVAGAGGATDLIKGFRIGTDKLVLNGGIGVQSQGISAGSVNLLLTDGTHVQLAGVTSTAHLFG